MSRFQASGIHFCISLAVITGVLALMLGLWYPGGYFQAMGGTKLLLILFGVDVCLGPLLTLVVFKSGKKSLKFDLAVIAALQVMALSYGTWVMFQARPVFTVFAADGFLVAGANDIEDAQLARAPQSEWRSLSWTGPVLVAADAPANPDDKLRLALAATLGLDLHHFPAYYVPYAERTAEVLRAAKPLAALRGISDFNNGAVDEFLKRQGGEQSAYVFVPLRTARERMAAVLDAKDASLIAIIPAQPS